MLLLYSNEPRIRAIPNTTNPRVTHLKMSHPVRKASFLLNNSSLSSFKEISNTSNNLSSHNPKPNLSLAQLLNNNNTLHLIHILLPTRVFMTKTTL